MANQQRNGAKEAYWRKLLSRHASSDLSVRAFCRREQVAESNFYAWRRTIAERDAQAQPRRRSASRRRQKASHRPQQPEGLPAFLPVAVTGERERTTSISIELRGGRRLHLPPSTSPERLVALIHALEGESPS